MEAMEAADSSSGSSGILESALDSGETVVVAARAEIDTSAPFESVKEAVDRFGGSAVWKSQLKQLVCYDKHHCSEDVDIVKVEEQAAQLQQALILKERETLDVLKDLEKTKKIVDDLKLRLQKATSDVIEMPAVDIDSVDVNSSCEAVDYDGLENRHARAAHCPENILLELKQAKGYLTRRTTDLTDIQASIELLNNKIKEEKQLLVKTQKKLLSNTTLISSMEDDLNQTTEKLQLAKVVQQKRCEDPSSILQEIKEKNFQIDQSRKLAETAKVEVTKLTLKTEQTKASIKTSEIRLLAAKKIEEAANATRDAALAEINALMSSDNLNFDCEGVTGVTLTIEEYVTLIRTVQEAEQKSRQNIETAMVQVDEANKSKSEVLTKVEEATQEVKVFTKALEDALGRVEAANRGKLAVEDALRKWRSEHGQKRRNVHNDTKFKTTAHYHKKDSHVIDLNGSALVTNLPNSDFRPPLSIGQILSMKLSSPESTEYDVGVSEKENEKPKYSLGQMLNKKQSVLSPQRNDTEDGSASKQFTAKKKKLGLVGFSLLLAKQSKKHKKRQSLTAR